MRFLRQLNLALILFTVSPLAFARGGPGAAISYFIEFVLMGAIIAGIVSGMIYGRSHDHMPWKGFGYTLLALVVIPLISTVVTSISILGFFLGIAAIAFIVFIPVFASACDMMRHTRLKQKASNSRSGDDNHKQSISGINSDRRLWRWISGTYLFWSVASFMNFERLVFMPIPPLIFFTKDHVTKLLPFLLPPLLVAIAIGVIATAIYYSRQKISGGNHYSAMLIFNCCVLFSFFISADIYRDHLMTKALVGHNPVHLKSSSFLNSVLSSHGFFRLPHASFEEQGKTYHWSYSERRFYQR